MELSSQQTFEGRGLLYPMMVIASIAVIVFSLVGIANVMGWMPKGLTGHTAVSAMSVTEIGTVETRATFECAECGVIESLREIERNLSRASPLSGSIVASVH